MTPTRLRRPRVTVLVLLLALALVSCGDGGGTDTAASDPPASDTPSSATPSIEATPTEDAATPTPTPSAEPSPEATETTSPTPAPNPTESSPPVELSQPAIWPAADVVFATPEEAATDFVSTVLGVTPTLGEFAAGDSRSGEIELRSPGEGDEGRQVPRGVLLLRQLGPADGWFVIGVANEFARVTAPETHATVPAAPLTVEGIGRGFEGTVVVTAYVPGDPTPIDQAIAAGGAFADPEAFTVELDLSGLPAGTQVALLLQGGTGLETDPGETGAIPVVVG
ncbi:hypothetical protein [Euzebya rosea]|uniref:hypothetical protein n=1 Tax=Euzebya rosea TaxID=2052804 RepID=UPI0013008372|nr:hypothetical protein [Euzebya rosea]